MYACVCVTSYPDYRLCMHGYETKLQNTVSLSKLFINKHIQYQLVFNVNILVRERYVMLIMLRVFSMRE